MIIIKCGRDSPFESALFILKEGAEAQRADNGILAEAERLVESAFADAKAQRVDKKQKKKKQK